jgi:ribosome-binding protein aMBF1 (putative translation factor)
MNTEMGAKAFEMKLDAELELAQARMQKLEAAAREKKAKAEIAAIDAARHLVHRIEKTRHSLHESTGKKAAEVQADIETARAQLHKSLEQLAAKLNIESHNPR